MDPYLEITEIADRTMKGEGPALLFRNVKGSRLPLLINQFGSERRMCMAFGVDSLDDLGELLEVVTTGETIPLTVLRTERRTKYQLSGELTAR